MSDQRSDEPYPEEFEVVVTRKSNRPMKRRESKYDSESKDWAYSEWYKDNEEQENVVFKGTIKSLNMAALAECLFLNEE